MPSRESAKGAIDVLLSTYSLNGALMLGCFCTNSLSCSFGSCSRAANEAGAMALARRTNPSHNGATVHTFLPMRRERRVVETKGWRDL